MFNSRTRMALLVALLSSTLLLTATPVANASSWVLTDESINLGLTGVSPHVERVAGGDRVWRSDGPAGTLVSLCSDTGSCVSEIFTPNAGGPINDVTVSQTPTGLRAYFKQADPRTNTQSIYSSPCLDATCLTLGSPTLTSPDMQVSMNVRGWGVPDPVRLSDGRIRLYNVESPTVGRCLEKVASYISTDGITFTKEPGWRLEGGYVDTEVLRATNGNWLMILADIACTSTNNQKLFYSTSSDGLAWSKPIELTGGGPSRLDPTGIEIAPNVFRIYYSMTSSNSAFTIQRATLTMGKATAATKGKASKTKATTTITCVKGKTVKKITAVNPRCPKGSTKR